MSVDLSSKIDRLTDDEALAALRLIVRRLKPGDADLQVQTNALRQALNRPDLALTPDPSGPPPTGTWRA